MIKVYYGALLMETNYIYDGVITYDIQTKKYDSKVGRMLYRSRKYFADLEDAFNMIDLHRLSRNPNRQECSNWTRDFLEDLPISEISPPPKIYIYDYEYNGTYK